MARKRIYLSVPHMGRNELQYVHEAFATNWLSTVGPNIDEFERSFSERIGLPAVALGSGTAALHLALRLVGVGSGDQVIVPTHTFVASVNPIRYLGAEPVFVDSDEATWMLDPALLAKALDERTARGRATKAVVVVHLYGQSADMNAILDVCRPRGIPVVEDAAEALGTLYKGRPAGSFGDVAAFSFNGNKIITATGGGMLVAQKEEWVEKARFWSTQAREPGVAFHHREVGYNYRLSNVLAGIGRGQLEVLDERVRQRRAVAFRYRDAFADLPGVTFMPQAPYGLHTNWLSCFLIDEERCATDRDGVLSALAELNIESRPLWKPMHLQPLYERCECHGGDVAAALFRQGICLPSSSSLDPRDQELVIATVRAALGAPAVTSEPARAAYPASGVDA
jgi:pyridoxal phosphate-dependent aminotransferase EpsN